MCGGLVELFCDLLPLLVWHRDRSHFLHGGALISVLKGDDLIGGGDTLAPFNPQVTLYCTLSGNPSGCSDATRITPGSRSPTFSGVVPGAYNTPPMMGHCKD